MALPEALSDGLQAIFDYADTACVPKKHHKSGSPSHVAHLRLDADTDYVHTYSILHAVDSVLRRPGHAVISLDKLLIRQAIRNDLLLTVQDGEASTPKASAKPVVELQVTFDDGLQRHIFGHDSGSPILRRDDPEFLAIGGIPSECREEAELLQSRFDFDAHPGYLIANWFMKVTTNILDDLKGPIESGDFIPLIHSVRDFEVPPGSYFMFLEAPFTFCANAISDRPLKTIPEGDLVSITMSFGFNRVRLGGGTVNFAMVPRSWRG